MSLKRKDIEILLQLKTPVVIKNLAQAVGTSERNLRYRLENLDYYLNKILGKKITREKRKISLLLTPEENDIFFSCIYKNWYILEQEERIEYILLLFLFIPDVTLSFIEKKLNITRATLKKDMELLEKELAKHDLFFYFSDNRFSVRGNEKKLRHLKTTKVLDSMKYIWLDFNLISSAFNKENLSLMEKYVRKIEENFHCPFSCEFKERMVVHLLITSERIQQGKYILRKNNFNFLKDTFQFTIVSEVLGEIIPKELKYEFAHLTEYFISGGNGINIYELRDSIELFTSALFAHLEKNLSLEISNNTELHNSIVNYLIPAIYRLKNNFSIGNTSVKTELYLSIESFCQKDKLLIEKLTENEIGYISSLIEAEAEKEKRKVISLKKLLEIIETNCIITDKDALTGSLLKEYGEIIKKIEPLKKNQA